MNINEHIIYPISIIKQKNIIIIFYNQFGISFNNISKEQLQEISNLEFIKVLINIYIQYSQYKPIVTLNNLFYLPKQPFKILINQICQHQKEYLDSIKQNIRILCKNKQILQKINQLTELSELKNLFPQQKQGKSISKLLQLKFINIKSQYKIEISSQQNQWIFKNIGFNSIPKYDLIYNGQQHNFDPNPLLKSILKNQVFYIIQNIKGNKIIFYPAVKYQQNTSLFGNYLVDKSKKSKILGLNNRSIHELQEQNYAVGYGAQILLCIGKLDIVISAFNITNISYFPCSYKIDKQKAQNAQHLLGSKFSLKQFQAYKII